MGLARHADIDDLLAAAVDHGISLAPPHSDGTTTPFGGRYRAVSSLPRNAIPEDGVTPEDAHQVIERQLALDGKPSLNLASFVSTDLNDPGFRLFRVSPHAPCLHDVARPPRYSC